jgi:hypothetical protein
MNVIKSSRTISRVNLESKTKVSETSSVSISVRNDQNPLTLMMETKLVSETLVFDSTLTRLIAREDFITE